MQITTSVLLLPFSCDWQRVPGVTAASGWMTQGRGAFLQPEEDTSPFICGLGFYLFYLVFFLALLQPISTEIELSYFSSNNHHLPALLQESITVLNYFFFLQIMRSEIHLV